MNKQNTSFKGVQALRGIAALSVMLFHFRWNINQIHPGLGDMLFGWGASGVDLFFLISGFVITLTAKKSEKGFYGSFSFLKKRIVRILPAYYLILLISFLLSGAMSTFHYADKTENLISALLFKPIYPDHGPFYVDDSGMYGIRWTLNYEVYFYLITAGAVFFKRSWLWVSAFFLIMLVIVPLVMWGYVSLDTKGYRTGSAVLALMTNPITFLFLTGMAIGLILPYLQKIPSALSFIGLMLTVSLCIYFFSKGQFSGHGIMSSGWLLAFLLTFVILTEDKIRVHIPGFLIKLGDISFSLYLIHTLVNNSIVSRLENYGLEPGWQRFLLSVIISLLLAWVSWFFIERKVLTGKMAEKRLLSGS